MKYKSNRCMLIVALMCSVMPYATRSFEMLNEESMNDTELPHYENYEETSLYDEEESENLTTLYDTNADNDNMDQIQPVQLDNEHLDDSKRLKIYRKLFINDLEISFNGDDVDVDMDEMILKAKYKDDIQYECDLPKSEFTGTFDWSVNGRFLGNNDSSYNIIIDRRISFLNVSCYFQMVNMSKFSWINFPPLSIDSHDFEFQVKYDQYLRIKYEKQIRFFYKTIMFVILSTVILVSIGVTYNCIVSKQNTEYNDFYSATV